MRIAWLVLLAAATASADTSPRPARWRGWIWIAEQGAGRLTAIDRSGRTVFTAEGLGAIRDFWPRPDGVIVTGGLDSRIREVSPRGKILREIDAPDRVYAVNVLRGGNLLVGLSGRVVEMTRDGDIVWEVQGTSAPEDVHPRKGGGALIAWYGGGRVEEVDATGRVVWSHAIASPMGLQPLADGSFLVTSVSPSAVTHVKRSGEATVVATGAGSNTPYAWRMRGGDLLLSTWSEVRRIGAAGTSVVRDGLNMAIKVREF